MELVQARYQCSDIGGFQCSVVFGVKFLRALFGSKMTVIKMIPICDNIDYLMRLRDVTLALDVDHGRRYPQLKLTRNR